LNSAPSSPIFRRKDPQPELGRVQNIFRPLSAVSMVSCTRVYALPATFSAIGPEMSMAASE
jgi:hypothetical protein